MGRQALEFLPSATLAYWRKMAYQRNRIAGWFGMGSASQLVVVVLYALLNFLIAGLGGSSCRCCESECLAEDIC